MSIFNALSKVADQAIKDSIKEISTSWDNFDFDEEMANAKRRMNIMSKQLERKIKKMQKHVRNMYDKWEVEVNYNQDEDIITSQIKDNTISIKVVKETDGSETTFSTTIPNDVIIDSLIQKYNPETKKAIFSFAKKDEV